jgi:hypothetical protein
MFSVSDTLVNEGCSISTNQGDHKTFSLAPINFEPATSQTQA